MKRIMILCVAALAMFATSCTKDATSFKGTNYEAIYKKTVNHQTVEVVSLINFTSEKDYKFSTEVIAEGETITKESTVGTYIVDGNKMIFTEGKETLTFIISGSTLKITVENIDLVYKKK